MNSIGTKCPSAWMGRANGYAGVTKARNPGAWYLRWGWAIRRFGFGVMGVEARPSSFGGFTISAALRHAQLPGDHVDYVYPGVPQSVAARWSS